MSVSGDLELEANFGDRRIGPIVNDIGASS